MINYVVALYVGERRNRKVSELTEDPTFFIRKHLNVLRSLNVPLIKKVTFVISPSNFLEKDQEALNYIAKNKNALPGIEIDYFIGEDNCDHSYGSWNFAMKKHINDGMHFFLIEDDYIPSADEFYLPFLNKISSTTAFVCQLYDKLGQSNFHAAISNGLMNVNAAKKHLETFGECIFVRRRETSSISAGVRAQLNFLKEFMQIGFKNADVSDEYCHPFLDVKHHIVLYGNTNSTTLIEPMFYNNNEKDEEEAKEEEEKNLKFLILLFYYERPDYLRNVLQSVKNSSHNNWELCVIDDGCISPAYDLINEVFSIDERKKHKITYIQTFDEQKNKESRGGSQFGEYANCVIKNSDADIVFMLCDDDMVKPDYMQRLNEFYLNSPGTKYSYSHLEFYDPSRGLPSETNIVSDHYTRYLVSSTNPINPSRNVDSSQVSWRRLNWMEDGISFPSPRTINLDEIVYNYMYVAWGDCPFNGIVGQYKGIHKEQLINIGRRKR